MKHRYLSLLVALMVLVGCGGVAQVSLPKADYKTKKLESIHTSFLAVGDNLIHSGIYKYADYVSGKMNDGKYNFDSFYTQMKYDISRADLSFINQETMMAGKKPSGYPLFCTPDDCIKSVSKLGFDVANGATNHSRDKGHDGIVHAINLFKKYKNITYVGLFAEQKDVGTVKVVKKNGVKFAFLSYTYGTNGIRGNGWDVPLFDKAQIKKDVAKAKKLGDVVIVSAHWGTEYSTGVNSFQKTYAQYFADQGVDLVIGTHPHVIEPMAWYQGKNGHKTLVVFSLGNFISNQIPFDTLLEGMFTCDIVKTGQNIQIKDICFTPLVMHYEASGTSAYTYKNQCVYKLKNYTETLAKRHKRAITKKKLIARCKAIMGSKFKLDL